MTGVKTDEEGEVKGVSTLFDAGPGGVSGTHVDVQQHPGRGGLAG